MLIFLDKFQSFMILDLLIAIASNALLVVLSKYSRSSKLVFMNKNLYGKKEVNLV